MRANRTILGKDTIDKAGKIEHMRSENQKELSRSVTLANGIPNNSEVIFEVITMQNTHKYYRIKITVEGDNSEDVDLQYNQETNKFRM